MSDQVKWHVDIGDAIVMPEQDGLTNVVTELTYRLTGERNGLSAFVFGRVPIGKPSPDNYKPFDQLTADEVAAWFVNTVSIEGLQAEVIAKLDALENAPPAPVIAVLPFNVPPPVPQFEEIKTEQDGPLEGLRYIERSIGGVMQKFYLPKEDQPKILQAEAKALQDEAEAKRKAQEN